MRDGWVKKELGQVCTLQRGFDLPKRYRVHGVIPLISASGCIDSHIESKTKGPGVVTGRSGSIGRVFYIEKDFWPLNTTLYIKDFHGNYPRFIYFLLKSFDLARYTSGTGVPTLNRNHVHKEIVRIPINVSEQKRIVAILDEAFAGIEKAMANTEKNLANAKELFDSYLESVFSQQGKGWKNVLISDIAYVKGGKRVPKGYKLLTQVTDHPYISVSDFNDSGSVDIKKVKYINEEVYQQISHYTISGNDVYISIAGTIGKTGIIPQELEGANLTENACKLVLKEGILNWYLYFFTKTKSFKEQALKNTRTTAQPKLSLQRLKTIRLPLPPIETQNALIKQLIDFGDQTKKIESIYQQKLTALAELKQSLLQKAFSGELTADEQLLPAEVAA